MEEKKEETMERKLLKTIVTKKLLDWLNELGRDLGEIAKEFGISPKAAKKLVLELLEESVKILKAKYESEQE